jgi:hypothetical protein
VKYVDVDRAGKHGLQTGVGPVRLNIIECRRGLDDLPQAFHLLQHLEQTRTGPGAVLADLDVNVIYMWPAISAVRIAEAMSRFGATSGVWPLEAAPEDAAPAGCAH